jgi:hypothetical protein
MAAGHEPSPPLHSLKQVAEARTAAYRDQCARRLGPRQRGFAESRVHRVINVIGEV